MLKMSFYDGTLNKEIAKEEIKNTNKPLTFRYGFSYRGATEDPISKDEAMGIIDRNGWLDINEFEDRINLNVYSANDMW